MHGLGTWLRVGGDPGVAVAAFLSFLGRVQLSDAGLSVSAARGKRRQQVFYYFNKIDLSLNLILPKYVFQFYNLIEFEICLTNFKSELLSFSRVGTRVSGVCIGPGGMGGGGCAGVIAAMGRKFLAAFQIDHIFFVF